MVANCVQQLVLKIFRFCSISNRGPIFTYCLDPPHPKLEISAQLLRVSKHFRDLGREILYGENRFYFDNFEQLDTWTTKIGAGAMAELRVIELTFNNDNNIYSARDFERYSKLKHLTVWLVDNSVFSDSELILHNLRRAQFPTRNPPLTFQDVLTRYPLPPKLQNGERVSSPARRLMPKTLPFFADCVLDLVRMDRLRIHAKIRQMRPDLSFASGDNVRFFLP